MNQNIPMKQLMTALEEVKYEQDNSFHFSKKNSNTHTQDWSAKLWSYNSEEMWNKTK